MNLSYIRYFVELAHVQHYTNAARNLNITQPSLSHAISQLEEELGVMLFEKNGRNTELTAFGREFLACAERSLGTLDAGVESIQKEAAGDGVIRLGLIRPLGMEFVPRLAAEYLKKAENRNPLSFKLPHPHVDGSPYDFSFSGLKTAVINLIHNAEQKGEILSVEDLSASFRKAVTDCLIENFIKAATDLGYNKLVMAGGVSANSLLRRRLQEECEKRSWEYYYPPLNLCGDNGAMVGAQGYYEFLAGHTAGMELNARATMSIDY